MMQQSRTQSVGSRQPGTTVKSTRERLYEPLDFVMVRTPLLPVEAYLHNSKHIGHGNAEDGSTQPESFFQENSLAPRDPRIRHALAVGSNVLLDALERSTPSSKDASDLQGKLLRFFIRMSTRPTPYGLFAGVALGYWGQATNLALAPQPPRVRTRLDMSWLLNVVHTLEVKPDVRKHLSLIANPTAFIRGERVFVSPLSTTGGSGQGLVVSVRATGAVKRALALARQPIPYQELAAALLAHTPGATSEKVEQLLAELWGQTVLLTDLLPPLTVSNPTGYVIQRLLDIPAAKETRMQLDALVDAATTCDALPLEKCETDYRHLLALTKEVKGATGESPVQVDMALKLHGQHIASTIGTEVAHATELLLSMTPWPNGLPFLEKYRQAFVARYGQNREVPVLELLDSGYGPGLSAMDGNGIDDIAHATNSLRSQTLLSLATDALHRHRQVIELDEELLERLETWKPSPDTAPISLDLNVFIAASSAKAIDAGQFQVIIGPNLGGLAAGRNLGRFADGIGAEAQQALQRAARAEAVHAPDKLWAELVYLPRNVRSANVAVRPAVRSHEITIGVSSGVDLCQRIPLDELVVGIRNNRFFVRWLLKNTEVIITEGHMLNSMQAPAICRFLAEISRDGLAQLSPFDWGPAASFPFLPRVQVGRIVLREAQWRIDSFTSTRALPTDTPAIFREALNSWREQWHVPRYVYLSFHDNRLLLDLESANQVEEVRTEVRRLRKGGSLLLQEVLPGLDQAWLEGPEGHYMSELVTSLVLRSRLVQDRDSVEASLVEPHPGEAAALLPASTMCADDRLKSPGSEWLFVKLYCAKAFEEDLIAYPLRTFAEEALAAGLADEWFFIRYQDPDLHLRLRFHGDPERLTGQLLPRLCSWASELMAQDFCLRFTIDTYDRELERYGGKIGTRLAESLFAADSRTVSTLITLLQERVLQLDRVTLGVLSVDNLLASLGLTEAQRLAWLRKHVSSRNADGQEYRKLKTALRSLLGTPQCLLSEPGGEALAQSLANQRRTSASSASRLAELAERGELNQSLDELIKSYVHMHCNRLFGSDGSAERRVLVLLLRTREGLELSGTKPAF